MPDFFNTLENSRTDGYPDDTDHRQRTSTERRKTSADDDEQRTKSSRTDDKCRLQVCIDEVLSRDSTYTPLLDPCSKILLVQPPGRPKCARSRATFAELGPNLAVPGPNLVDVARLRADLGRLRAILGRTYSNSRQIGSNLAEFAPSLPNSGQFWPIPEKRWPNSGYIWPIPGRSWSKLARCGPKSVERGPNLIESAGSAPGAEHTVGLRRSRAKCRTRGPRSTEFNRVFGPNSAKVDPQRANVWRFRPELVRQESAFVPRIRAALSGHVLERATVPKSGLGRGPAWPEPCDATSPFQDMANRGTKADGPEGPCTRISRHKLLQQIPFHRCHTGVLGATLGQVTVIQLHLQIT